MLAIWTHSDTGPEERPLVEAPQWADSRYVHEYPVYGGRSEESYNFRSAEDHSQDQNAGMGPARVPMFLPSVQWNALDSSLGSNWGFRFAVRGQATPQRSASVTVQVPLEQNRGAAGTVQVIEPGYLPLDMF